jgi:hypothetical protein
MLTGGFGAQWYQGQPMQLTKMFWVRDGATDLGRRLSAYRDRPNLLAVGNFDRGWLVAFLWTQGTRAEGSKMMSRLGMFLYRCSVAIAFMCGIAALTILAALVTNKLSDSEAWIAVVFFAVVGGFSWMVGRAARAPDDVLSD